MASESDISTPSIGQFDSVEDEARAGPSSRDLSSLDSEHSQSLTGVFGSDLSVVPNSPIPAGAESDTDSDIRLFVSPDDSFSEEEWSSGTESNDRRVRFSRLQSTRRLIDEVVTLRDQKVSLRQDKKDNSIPATEPDLDQVIDTMWHVLKPVVGSPVKTTTDNRPKSLSARPIEEQEERPSLVPFSPFFKNKVAELSSVLAGDAASEGADSEDRAYNIGRMLQNPKMRLGWYRVPRQHFDFAPATLDPLFTDMGIRERDHVKIPTKHVARGEKDARTTSLIASFLDTSGSTASKLIQDTLSKPLTVEGLEKTLRTVGDLEKFRGRAVEHLLGIASVTDANFKLVRRAELIPQLELSPQLATAAYRLPLDPAGTHLFGPGLRDLVMKMNNSLTNVILDGLTISS